MVAPGELLVLPDSSVIAQEAADRVCGWASEAIDARGVAHLALTGGSSAAGLYEALREPQRVARIDWTRIQLWWGDERLVPLDHPDSNAGLALDVLLGRGENDTVAEAIVLPIPSLNVHPLHPGDETDPEAVAAAYAAGLSSAIERRVNGLPAFDVILLGMGPDGHILSVFPGSPALGDGAPLAMPIEAPTQVGPHVPRVTLSPRLLGAADHVLVMISGEAKAATVATVLGPERDPARWPAQLAIRPNATWLLDKGSAARLRDVTRSP
jgi:6-phosphogluconolactonase